MFKFFRTRKAAPVAYRVATVHTVTAADRIRNAPVQKVHPADIRWVG